MSVLPTKRSELIQFFTQRLSSWQADPTAIGLSVEAVTELAGKTASASSLYQAALVARQGSRDATSEYYTGTDDLREFGAAQVAAIKAFAQTSGDPGVYALASIPEPADPTPSAPPAVPTNVSLSMRPQGTIDIAWEGSVAQGTFYEVQRSLDDGVSWTTITSVPARETLDAGVPSRTPRAYYRIRGVKGAAGAGSPDRQPRYSAWTAPQVVFLGVPGNQQEGATLAA